MEDEFKCCDNPSIEVLDDPASDGISYETCTNCGLTSSFEIYNPDNEELGEYERDYEYTR